MNETVPHSLRHLKTGLTGGAAVWGGFGGVALLEGDTGVGFESKKPCLLPVCSVSNLGFKP